VILHVRGSSGSQPVTAVLYLSATAVPKSSPHKCTPEEIQKKLLEAKKKLEKKRLTVLFENNKQYHHSKCP